jgi:hypothetical protein
VAKKIITQVKHIHVGNKPEGYPENPYRGWQEKWYGQVPVLRTFIAVLEQMIDIRDKQLLALAYKKKKLPKLPLDPFSILVWKRDQQIKEWFITRWKS